MSDRFALRSPRRRPIEPASPQNIRQSNDFARQMARNEFSEARCRAALSRKPALPSYRWEFQPPSK